MLTPAVLGALVLGLPAIFVAYIAFWWRRRPIFWLILALVVVGLGYLGSTGALFDIGASIGEVVPGLAS
jgi:hypothetical protein